MARSAVMTEKNEADLLLAMGGDWQGLTRLHAGHADQAEHASPAWLRCVQAGTPTRARLRYVWTFEDRIREGHVLLAMDPATRRASAAWMDSGVGGAVGGAEVLSLRGWLDDTGLLRLSGQSSDAEAAGWTWRLELDCPEPGQLELRLYTTSPQGEEELAASSEYRR